MRSTSLLSTFLVIISTLALCAYSQPVDGAKDAIIDPEANCKKVLNAILIQHKLKTEVFRQRFCDNRTCVPEASGLYLDAVEFQGCGMTYCNKKHQDTILARDTEIMNPKGEECALAYQSVSTFMCNDEGRIFVKVDKEGKSTVNAVRATAYYESQKDAEGCYQPSLTAKSSTKKDVIRIDCSGSFQKVCPKA